MPLIAERAFDMFYRGSVLSTGSGLGLYLVKEIVSKLNGEVSLESKNGVGTIVEVRVPNHS